MALMYVLQRRFMSKSDNVYFFEVMKIRCLTLSTRSLDYAWQLRTNACIFSGTPSGVGPVKAGQRMKAGITGLAEMSFEVKARKPHL